MGPFRSQLMPSKALSRHLQVAQLPSRPSLSFIQLLLQACTQQKG
jgi:hypothetical protein